MNQLVLAQGAEHTNQDRLRTIVQRVNFQRAKFSIAPLVVDQVVERVRKYIPEYDASCIDMEELRHIMMDYSVEEKFDGYSYLNTEGRFFSKRLSAKKGHEGEPIEKTDHLWYIAEILRRAYEKFGCDLHGEIYIPGGTSDDMTKILGCNTDEAQRRVNDLPLNSRPHYRLLDIRAINGKSCINEPYYVRRMILQYVYNCILNIQCYGMDCKHYFVLIAPILRGDPRDEFRRIVTGGGEGIIMKRTSALYVPGKKPADNWIKGKRKITLDVVIMGYNDGTGKNKALFGSIKCGMYINGKLEFCGNCSSGLSDELRIKMSKDLDSYINTVIEIEAIQESVKSLRNARFIRLRDDKDAIDCTPLNITVQTELYYEEMVAQ